MIRVAIFNRTSQADALAKVTFKTLLVNSTEDYTCEPPCFVTIEDVKGIAEQLSRLPQVRSGTVNDFLWVELEPVPG